jgi:RimJ/RimL family protein N-acetyltransferase
MTGEAVRLNALGQPIGVDVPGWQARPRPPRTVMEGTWCRLEPIDPDRHAAELHAANAADTKGAMWTYMNHGPFADLAQYRAWMDKACMGDDPLFFAIRDAADGKAKGLASYLRINPTDGVIEVGSIAYSPALQKTVAATETMYLMMRRAFDELGYRRYEWKCDTLNAPSRAAADRLGFRYEGTFVQATMYKGRNRDTAWYAITDKRWPEIKQAFEAWLAQDNFGADGRQRVSLSAFMPPG